MLDMEQNNHFRAPAQSLSFAALLFDMDGTIIDSTPAVVKYWMAVGEEVGVPGEQILRTSHGRRSIDILAEIAPERATWEYVKQEEAKIPKLYGEDAIELPGSRALLDSLERAKAPWAIVTSGTRRLVGGWLEIMKLAHPKVLVTAENVAMGKPNPECYLLGAKQLGFGAEECSDRNVDILVLEDAPAGVRAGKAAGYQVVALATTHEIDALRAAGADWIVKDLSSVSFRAFDAQSGQIHVEIQNALVI